MNNFERRLPSRSESLRIMVFTAALAVAALKVFNTVHGLTLDYLEAAVQPECEFGDSIGLTPELIEQMVVRAGDHDHTEPELLLRDGDRTPGYVVRQVSTEACKQALLYLEPVDVLVSNGGQVLEDNPLDPLDLRPPRPLPEIQLS